MMSVGDGEGDPLDVVVHGVEGVPVRLEVEVVHGGRG